MTSSTLPNITAWRALQILSAYRAILALALLLMFYLRIEPTLLGERLPGLFYNANLIFIALGVIAFLFSSFLNNFFYWQLRVQVILDIVIITLMMHASGGNASGLGVLIAVSTSAASILIGTPSALAYSVIASLFIFGEEIYSAEFYLGSQSSLAKAGILSVTFMATSLLAYYLARRVMETEQTAKESIKGLKNMEKLNEEIIQFMTTGVLVVDEKNAIRLINHSAWAHLGMPDSTKSKRLEQISTPLARQLTLWRRKPGYHSKEFKNTVSGPNLLPKFAEIGGSKDSVIIFLEDTTQVTQQAQRLKLASLGRLTASIAHEIRNPLGALSHAAQLMADSEDIITTDRELLDIVINNAKRVNTIIENIMQLSQRNSVVQKEINLSHYLPAMLKEYCSAKNHPPIIDLQFQSENLLVHFDQSQLGQILTNLIDNAARYSELKTGKPRVMLMVGIEDHSQTAFLDVIDKGDGIPPELSEKIFEPFFTTSQTGTGLGLYLSKELCEANHARLTYIPLPTQGACFRVSFSVTHINNH